jgi:rubrerythrin
MKREFSSLTAREALHVAIFIEQRNADIYSQFAELFEGFKDPESVDVAAAFWDMANEERRHGTELQERYADRYGPEPCLITEEEIREAVELPKFQSGDIFAITRAQVSRVPSRQALELALAAENSALKFYTRLAEMTDDDELRELYEELAGDESEHTKALLRKIRGGQKLAVTRQA